jgi:inner membrane protein involved in colicin E2 resistance
MVSNLISERESYRNDVENTLRQSTSGPQKLVGPLIAIPVTEIFYKLEDEKRLNTRKVICISFCRSRCLLTATSTLSPVTSASMTARSGIRI